jgi:threonine/homoserine/homoserine lactone efflux protein
VNPDLFWLSALLVKSFCAGLAVAAPMGPVGVLCLRRTLAQGWAAGLLTGLGAASADAVFGLVVALGLSWLTDWLLAMGPRLRGLSGLGLLGLGAALILAPAREGDGPDPARRWLRDYGSALVLCLGNPLVILALTALFAALGLTADLNAGMPAALAVGAGVFLGSLAWFALLCAFAMRFHPGLAAHRLRRVNQITGVVLGALGLAMLLGWDLAC